MRNYEERIENILNRLDEQMTIVVANLKLNEKIDPEDDQGMKQRRRSQASLCCQQRSQRRQQLE